MATTFNKIIVVGHLSREPERRYTQTGTAMGGPSRTQLTPEQREADYDARVIISSELGHSREAITAAYLGR